MSIRRSVLLAVALVAVPAVQLLARTEPFHPLRMGTPAFGGEATVEVRDLPRVEAEAAIRAALVEVHELDRLADPAGDHPLGIAQLNAAAGLGPREVDPRIHDLLRRMLQICAWTHGAYGPLGGELAELWRTAGRRVSPGDLRMAVIRADCSRLAVSETGPPRAELAADSRADLRPVAAAYAVDRAVEVLRAAGAGNVLVTLGDVHRGLGGGVDGKGWLVALPKLPANGEPIDRIWLRDQALAVASAAGEEAALVDQRTGVRPRGVATVVAVSELAVEAQSLAESLYILGLAEGQLRLGSLEPSPSVYWLLGEERTAAVESTYNWSVLESLRRRR